MVERSFNDILSVNIDSNETKIFNSTTAGILKATSPDGEVIIDSDEVIIPGLIVDTASFALTASYATLAASAISSSYALTASYLTGTVASASYAVSASYAFQAGNSSTINVNVFGAPVDSYLLMSNVAGTTGVAIGGDADLRYNTSTNVLTAPNISATTLTGSLLGTASYAMSALSASFYGGSVISASYAVTASKLTILNEAVSSGTYYPIFAYSPSGVTAFAADASTYTYQPSTNILTVTASSAFTASYVEPYETAWTSYTPIWTTDGTQPTLGDGSLTGAYKLIGKTCFVRVRLYWGTTTNSGTGTFYFSLPVSASTSWGIQMPASLLDNGNAWYQATVNGEYGGFTNKTALIGQSAGGANSSQGVTGVFPVTFGNLDSIQFNGSYETI